MKDGIIPAWLNGMLTAILAQIIWAGLKCVWAHDKDGIASAAMAVFILGLVWVITFVGAFDE